MPKMPCHRIARRARILLAPGLIAAGLFLLGGQPVEARACPAALYEQLRRAAAPKAPPLEIDCDVTGRVPDTLREPSPSRPEWPGPRPWGPPP